MHRQLAANSHEHDDLLLSHVTRLMTVTAWMHQRLHHVVDTDTEHRKVTVQLQTYFTCEGCHGE